MNMSIQPKIQYKGLTRAQVEASRERYGVNVLTPPKGVPLWRQFIAKFSDPLIIVLVVAGMLSVGISFYEYYGLGKDVNVFFEPVGIFVAVLLATGCAFIFEYNAEKEFRVLNRVNDDEAVEVVRDAAPVSIPRRDVVVGDIVFLHAGDEVPADCRLLEATSLSVDESTLTGEPVTHKWTSARPSDPEATFPSDCVYKGTKVMEGHAVAEVVAVGDSTESGKVSIAARIDDGRKTPLDQQLDRLGRFVARISYMIAFAVIVGRMVVYFIELEGPFVWMDFITYALQTLMIGVALVAVSVPEGLPMAVTLSLALSMRRMLKTNNLVRKLHACETMGAADIICTDKTGTLTQNRMQVAAADFFGVDREDIARSVAVNSTANLERRPDGSVSVLGNPTEGALLLWLEGLGVDYNEVRREASVVAEIPFSTELKYMATELRQQNEDILFVKGAPEVVLAMCDRIGDGTTRSKVEEFLSDAQSRAMRTLGFAVARGKTRFISDNRLSPDTKLTFIGMAAISDPVREDVPAAVEECRKAGIGVKIVTGDTSATATQIGLRIGLFPDGNVPPESVITGPEFAALSDKDVDSRAEGIRIISRARPLDKKRLVEALRQHGHVVAATGDGTNDAPALKAADVGLSMGDGTAVAKEASDITIIDNSFASIGRAVKWGRSLYLNIQRFIYFQMTVNVVACLVVLIGSFTSTQSPLTVTQMLWVNLIMDTFAAMALASLPPSDSVMESKPRCRDAFIITPGMGRLIIGAGILMAAFLIWLMWFFCHYEVDSLLNISAFHKRSGIAHMSDYELSLYFTIFVFMQVWNMFNARAYHSGRSAFRLAGCRGFILTMLLILVGQLLIVSYGGQMFGVVPLRFSDWIIIIVFTSVVLWIGELLRLVKK